MVPKLSFNGVSSSFSKGLFDLKFLNRYSTSSEKTPLMVDYLVKSLGFSEEEAISTSSKAGRFKSTEKPDSVLNFLKQLGFDKARLKKIVFVAPKVLCVKVDKTLKPKIKAFLDHGLSGSELIDVLSATPLVFTHTSNLKSALDVLNTFFSGNNDAFVACLKSSNWILTSGLNKHLQSNLDLLQKYGLSTEKIQQLLCRRARYLLRDPEWVERILVRVEEELGIPRKSPMFVHGFLVIAAFKQDSLELKFELFRSYGWTDADIFNMARKLPYCLASSETKIRQQLDFFMKEHGCDPEFIASRPVLLKLSMEKRILPRLALLQALKNRKLMDANYSLYSSLAISQSDFLKRFVHPLKDGAPDIYEAYMKSTGSSA